MKTEPKMITLKQIGYKITGIADLTLWGGGNACIEMKPFYLKKCPDKKTLMKNINDNGFGVESINGAICDIYEHYEHDVSVYIKTITVGEVSNTTKKIYYDENYIF